MGSFVRKYAVLVAVLGAIVLLAASAPALATSGWYQVTFTGADMWNYSAYNGAQTALQQDAPHRYATYATNGARTVVATTWGIAPPDAAGNFTTWATANQSYAIDQFNLWGGDGLAANWGEKYVTPGNNVLGAEGMSDWQLISAPAGWTSEIVKGNNSWSIDATHAFPVWRVGTGTALTQLNMNDPQFRWTFDVLVSNVQSAFETNGSLKVFWGGSHDDFSDVAGIMKLQATAVPEPVTILSVFGAVAGIGAYVRRRMAVY